jgi:hypothetical protein
MCWDSLPRMDVHQAIAAAEAVLPGRAAPAGEKDSRWEAMIAIAGFLADDPEPICAFIIRWGSYADADLQSAVASVLLEHLLELHFTRFFPAIEAQVRRNTVFADTFSRCWKFGQADEAPNAARFDALLEFVRGRPTDSSA